MDVPTPTPIFRFVHVDNLHVCLKRGAVHAPNHTPKNGLAYKTIHNLEIQQQRKTARITGGAGGVIHDYVAFYFGPRTPMLFQLHTGRVQGYSDGQDPLIYLVSAAQTVANSGSAFVFSDGHGIAKFTSWYDNLKDLDKVDWDTVYAKIWKDTVDDMDRQRRKQAEFLIHRECDWALIQEIGVLNTSVKTRVEEILSRFPTTLRRRVRICDDWYYSGGART